MEADAPLQPPQKSRAFVIGKVMTRASTQERKNLAQCLVICLELVMRLRWNTKASQTVLIGYDFCRNLRNRQYIINEPRRDRVTRHVRVFSFAWLLHNANPAILLDPLQPH